MCIRRIVFLALIFVSISAFSRNTTAQISCTTESPVDGSLWIGTDGDGIFRLGRNGRKVWYHVESGHLTSDHILCMGFDNNKVLWILDNTGTFTSYTSVDGFKQVLSFPDPITTAAVSSDSSQMYFSTDKMELYVFDFGLASCKLSAKLPATALSLMPSVEDNSLWGLTSGGIFKVSSEGSFLAWDQSAVPSNLLPFEFDTNVPENTSSTYNSTAVIFLFISIILFIVLVVVLYYILFRRRNSVPVVKSQDSPSVEEISGNKPSEVNSSDTLDKPEISLTTAPTVDSSVDVRARVLSLNNTSSPKNGTFTKTVKDLIQKNLSDPDFDVDTIASITGLSRIHVNRKLKAEGSPSPSVMLKDARMALAVKLLKEGKFSVSQIGASCGFSRPSYFATAFKEYFNVSPSDYLSTLER